MLSRLLDLLFPRQSLTGDEGTWITEKERQSITLTPLLFSKPMLEKRGLQFIDAVLSAGSYDASPLLKKLILTFKYKRISDLHSDLAAWMLKAIHSHVLTPKMLDSSLPYHSQFSIFNSQFPPVLCPVPLHWSRRFERGFNQSLLLATVIGESKNFRTEELLKRTRATGHQAHRSRAERLTALIGAFAYRASLPPPATVILVDDLFTTGATLDECAKALKKAGVKTVFGLTAAYG